MSDQEPTLLFAYDQIRQRFLDALSADAAVRLESYLEEAPAEHRANVFRALLAAELNFRLQHGESLHLPGLQERFPQYVEIIEEVRKAELDSAKASFQSTVDYYREQARCPTPAIPLKSASSSQMTGRYRLDFIVGRGGFGEVWKAYDPQLDRVVAVKLPRQDRVFTPAQMESFLSEARRVARLKIAGVVSVHDVGQQGATRFIVSDFVDGSTLADRIRDQRFTWKESAQMIADVAETLHRAHLQDIVHRDVKPNNILLDRAGNPFVTDFGLAIHETEQLHEPEAVLGTFAYMSPEQARGTSNRVDARADIYSLGVILYQLLAGRLPFVATSTTDYQQQILHREARPPRTIDDTIPAELERICLKCLAKAPTDRYSTARDLASELRTWIQTQEIQIYTPPPPSSILPYVSMAALACAVILGILSLNGAFSPRPVGIPTVQTPGLPERKPSTEVATIAPAVEVKSADAPAPVEKDLSVAAVERAWQNQMKQLPQELIWPGYKGGGLLGFRATPPAYEIASGVQRVVQLGVLDDLPCRVGINIEQQHWNSGTVGIFVGYHEVDTPAGRAAEMQLIDCSRNRTADGQLEFRVSRSVIRISPQSGYPNTTRELGYQVVPTPPKSPQTVRLELELRGHKLVGGSWNGETLTFCTDAQNSRTTPADYTGPWGLYSQLTTSYFRYPSLQLF